ncbi:uncharacterized protein K02A2.6-like [Armigeres subalbatus]|uniref:uncharacterized protein K02A2.6-like n=1 Tax=Armigeres subalbatus TaxID=124917 RepID=UPI002ED0B873
MPGSGDFQVIYQQILRQNQAMAEQNTRLMEMMERFGYQENISNRSVGSPEFIIESPTSNIREFVYDPDNGLVFDRWYRKYEDLFLNNGAKLDDAAKVRLLLRSLSVMVHDKYVNFVLPKHPFGHRVQHHHRFKEAVEEEPGLATLIPTTRTTRTASGDAFHLLGELRYPIKLGGVTKTATFYVTNNSINLIGLDWIELFKLWDTPLSAICNQVHVADGQVNQIQVYKAAYSEVFKNGLGHCKKTKVRLYLKPDAKPVFKPKRPVPFTSMEKIDAELDRLQSLGIITPVDFSQWAAPIVVVKKPRGKVRICADYSTGLNAALEPNHYPLPVPDDIFTKLNGCRYFSVIDLSDAYLQVEVDDDSKQLLTINTHRGLFRFNRAAPGVKSAPEAFQQLMNSMVADLEGVDTFLDDIFVASKTEEEHHKMLNALFQRLQAYGFVLREEKCNILQPEVKYLAHIVDENGLRPDPSKVKAIVKMPPPKDVTTSDVRKSLLATNEHVHSLCEIY